MSERDFGGDGEEQRDRLLRSVPPHNLEAERSVLGAMMIEPGSADLVSTLHAEDFYKEAHATVYGALLELLRTGRPLDVLLLREQLERAGLLDAVGGVVALAEITDSVPSSANIEHYARIVQDHAQLRRLATAAIETQREAFAAQQPAEEVCYAAERRILAATQRGGARPSVPLADLTAQVFDRIDRRRRGEADDSAVLSGFDDLDNLTMGFHRGELTILAARPSMGKTSMGLSLLRNMARSQRSCGFFSLEMPGEQLTQNLLAQHASVPSFAIRRMTLSQADENRLVAAREDLDRWLVQVDDTPGLSVGELRSKVRRMVAQHHVDAVFVDYLQLLTSSRSDRNRQEEVTEISGTLKQIARENGLPVIALAQLNRKSEERPDKRPRMADLRESGSVEQDADLVLLLHRDEYYQPENPEVHGKAQLLVAKNRNGPVGTVELAFTGALMRFDTI